MFNSLFLIFFSPLTTGTNYNRGNGRLNPTVVNRIWNEICAKAGVEGRTPHCARHAMGKHIMEKTGNPGAVQRQLGHTNVAFSVQYSRITENELEDVLEDR